MDKTELKTELAALLREYVDECEEAIKKAYKKPADKQDPAALNGPTLPGFVNWLEGKK